MTNKKPVFRHELKYRISYEEKDALIQRLQAIVSTDKHAAAGGYKIRSVYFDDIKESAYQEKLAGVNYRKKYRIRCYDDSDSVIKLECKRKEEQYIQKTAVSLSRYETEQILKGHVEVLLDRPERLCREFYIDSRTHLLKPNVIVDYEREPYVYPYGDVRITFDSHVRAGLRETELFDWKQPVLEVLEPGTLIMEVKFTEYLPTVIRELLPCADSAYMAASKYVMCMEKRREYTMK